MEGIAVAREIPAPAQHVWSLVVDWEKQGRWMPATAVRVLPGPNQGTGTRVEATTGIGPVRVSDPMHVVAWEPPRRCVVRHEGRVLRGTAAFMIEPLGPQRCRMIWREDLELPGALERHAAVRPVAAVIAFVLVRTSKPFFALALRRLSVLATTSTTVRW